MERQMVDGEALSSCRYAVLACRCQLPSSGSMTPDGIHVEPSDLTANDNDLLLTLDASRQLRVFRRRQPIDGTMAREQVNSAERRHMSCVLCAREPSIHRPSALPSHCHPVVTYLDYALLETTIPLASITQVLLTYRSAPTTRGSLATRTSDLLLRTQCCSGQENVLWLAFEHNLVRGWFLEALTVTEAMERQPAAWEVDYIDVSDGLEASPLLPLLMSSQATTTSSLVRELEQEISETTPLATRFPFLRDALRLVVYDRVKLSLQLDRSEVLIQTNVLASALAMAKALDEPDLAALAWLANGYMNMQSTKGTLPQASAQLQSSLDVARANSLAYTVSLVLQCLAEFHLVLVKEEQERSRRMHLVTTALTLLEQAARSMPPCTDGDSEGRQLRMQLHHKVRDLRTCIASAGTTIPSSLPAFDLWAYTFDRVAVRSELLHRVLKPVPSSPRALHESQRGGSFFVHVLDMPLIDPSAKPRACFRVFFQANHTFDWLRGHVQQRLDAVTFQDTLQQDLRIERFVDPITNRFINSSSARICEWMPREDPAGPVMLHAMVATSTGNRENMPPTVTCSLCHQRLALDALEEHSDICY